MSRDDDRTAAKGQRPGSPFPKPLAAATRRTSRWLEGSMVALDATLRGFQGAAARAGGAEPHEPGRRPPLDGPGDLDGATSDWSNRMLRMALGHRLEDGPVDWFRGAMRHTARSLPAGLVRDPRRWLSLPFELPLSFATLGLQEALRGLVAAQAVRPEALREMTEFLVETFSDLEIYFTLQYDDLLHRMKGRLADRPDDPQLRYDLARTYLKCGLFKDSLRELERTVHGGDGGLRSKAYYWMTVAAYRAGDDDLALRAGAARLDGAPEDDRARYWMWLASKRRGSYPAAVPPQQRLEEATGWHPSDLRLEDVAAQMGLDKTSGGRGTAILDVTGDGRHDVVVAGAHAGCSLYLNNGDGTFTDASVGSGLDACVYAFGLAAGDFDNDGRQDLFVTGLGFFDGQGILLHNEGDGTFTDVTADAGLNLWGPGFTASWVDFDGDGRLDLYVVNNLGGLFDRKTPNRLFHNNGDGTFTDVTADAGLVTRWPSLGHCWADFTNNGLPDLFVSNLGRAQLFLNQGDGTFVEAGREAGVDLPAIGSAAFPCDIDDDGWLDIVQLTYSSHGDTIHTLRHGRGPKGGFPLRVFRNRRDGTFAEVASELGLRECWGSMSGNAGDLGNKGAVDLVLGNGDPAMDRSEATILFERQPAGFRNVTFTAGLPVVGKGHGVNMADLLGDGRLHLIVGAGGLYPGDLMTTTVHRPVDCPGHVLNGRLRGPRSNRDAIGARVSIRAGGTTQHRLVSGGSGFGCLPLEQHFGLGETTRVDGIDIRWPSGLRQTVETPPADTTLEVTEGTEGWRRVYGGDAEPPSRS
ncbi:MAG: FG-GAP-like repeat-containing protein [Acidobacteriota bacterium]